MRPPKRSRRLQHCASGGRLSDQLPERKRTVQNWSSSGRLRAGKYGDKHPRRKNLVLNVQVYHVQIALRCRVHGLDTRLLARHPPHPLPTALALTGCRPVRSEWRWSLPLVYTPHGTSRDLLISNLDQIINTIIPYEFPIARDVET